MNMEPNPKHNNHDDDTHYIDEMGFNKDSYSNQSHFLTLRKNKRLNLQNKKLETEKSTQKYKLDQNSYNQSNEIILNFFNSQDKPTFLHQLISNIFNSMNNSNIDLNLIKFIIVQCLNYYESQKENTDNVKIFENFFTEPITNNLIQIIYFCKNEAAIVYNICLLLIELTFRSSHITKLITLNIKNIKLIFDCLDIKNDDIQNIVLSLLYNLYMEDENTVNTNCNIGVYVFESLNNYSLENQKALNKTVIVNENIKALVSFLDILINPNTSPIYKTFDIEKRNNIIYLLLLLCRDVYDEKLKLDSHNALERLLSIAEPEDINIDRIGLVNIPDIFLPHIKLETNSSEMVEISMDIIEKFSYLCDVEIFINNELISQLEQILISFIDMDSNKSNPKPFYKNYKKRSVNKILKNLSITLMNAITLLKLEKYISKETNIINNLTLCLKINDLENKTLCNIYDFFKEFIHNKDNCVKVILANFIDIGILDIIKNNLSNKNYEVIQSALDVCLLMMKKCNELTSGKGNIIKMYLDKKGFNDILNLVAGVDFGNINCSETAKNIQDNFFK